MRAKGWRFYNWLLLTKSVQIRSFSATISQYRSSANSIVVTTATTAEIFPLSTNVNGPTFSMMNAMCDLIY